MIWIQADEIWRKFETCTLTPYLKHFPQYLPSSYPYSTFTITYLTAPTLLTGESYLDVVQRLGPVFDEIEKQEGSLCIVAHQAILRVVYGRFMGIPAEEIPRIEIPLHTLIELTLMPGENDLLER